MPWTTDLLPVRAPCLPTNCCLPTPSPRTSTSPIARRPPIVLLFCFRHGVAGSASPQRRASHERLWLQTPGSAAASPEGKPEVPGADGLSSQATNDEDVLGRFLVFAAGGVVPGRALPDPGAQKTAPPAFKVLQWLLYLEGPRLEAVRGSLGFPFHLGGLDRESSDVFVEAMLGASSDVLHLVVEFMAEQGFLASVPWARGNLAAVRFRPPHSAHLRGARAPCERR